MLLELILGLELTQKLETLRFVSYIHCVWYTGRKSCLIVQSLRFCNNLQCSLKSSDCAQWGKRPHEGEDEARILQCSIKKTWVCALRQKTSQGRWDWVFAMICNAVSKSPGYVWWGKRPHQEDEADILMYGYIQKVLMAEVLSFCLIETTEWLQWMMCP